MAEKWMQAAVKREGALTRKAEAAGMGTVEFARAHAHDPGLTGQQARFAITARRVSKRRRRGSRAVRRLLRKGRN